jgi:hypothetical protein
MPIGCPPVISASSAAPAVTNAVSRRGSSGSRTGVDRDGDGESFPVLPPTLAVTVTVAASVLQDHLLRD